MPPPPALLQQLRERREASERRESSREPADVLENSATFVSGKMGGSLPKLNRVAPPDEGAVTVRPQPKRTRSFGELEFDFEAIAAPMGGVGSDDITEDLPLITADDSPPPSSGPLTHSRVTTTSGTPTKKPSVQTRATRQGLEAVRVLAEEETRIAKAGVLDEAITRSRFPNAHAVLEEASTKIATLDSMESVKSLDKASAASGVATKDDRVAELREAYARGDTQAALALAASITVDLVASEPDPFDDPFGGLIPVDDDGEALSSDLGVVVQSAPPLPLISSGFGGLEPIYDEAEDFADHTAILDASSPDSGRVAALTALTSQTRTPRLLCAPKDIANLPMDPRAAFLLGHVDGRQSMEEILDVCAMPESEALELLERLRVMGVIEIE